MPVNISGNGSITGLTDLAEPTEINSGSNDLVLKAHGAESLKCTSTETIFDKKINVDGDVQTTSLNGGQLAGFRNKLINGSMGIYQRGTTGPATAGFQTADRWRINGNRASEIAVGPTEYDGSLGSAVNGETLSIRQAIELPVKTNGTPAQFPFLQNSVWTLSFDAIDSGGSGGTVDASLGWFTSSSGSGVLAHAAAAQQSLTGTWQRFTFTFTITTTSLDSTWRCLNCNIILTGTGKPRITQVQLEPGHVATPFEHRPYGTELALCQRYYQTETVQGRRGGGFFHDETTNNGPNLRGRWHFCQEMRAAPSVTLTAVYGDGIYGGWTPSVDDNWVNTITTKNVPVKAGNFTFVGSSGNGGTFNLTMTADAEL